MKQLLIMRHAKANPPSAGESDFDRTLNDRGVKDAEEMGQRILLKDFIPELIIASPAKRTHKTAKEVAKKIGYNTDLISYESDIYEAHSDELLFILRAMDDSLTKIMLVGHNPGVTGLVGILTKSLIEHIPTAGVALVTFDLQSWKQLSLHTGILEWFDFPKNS
jgi:phosphohistidine phosphatase